MAETQTPYDEAAQNAALRGDHNEANDFRNMALGYRAALSSETVTVEELQRNEDRWVSLKAKGLTELTLMQYIHGLQIPKAAALAQLKEARDATHD